MKNFKKHLGWFVMGALVVVCLGFTIVEGLRVRTPGSVGQPGIGKVLMATTSDGDVAWTNQIVLAAATGISLHPSGQTITISNSASAGGAGSTNFQGARILKTTSSQSIPANTATLVTFNTVVYDTDSMTASANQLTMPRDGYYRITAQLYWNGSGAGTSNYLRMLYIRVGGSVGKDIGAEVNYQVDNELCMQNASAVIYMLQSDPVTIMATHSRSAAEFLLTDPTLDGCFLEAVYLGSDVAAGGTVTPAGDSGAIQFNEGDAFAGTNDFTFDRTNRLVRIKGALSVTEAINANTVTATNGFFSAGTLDGTMLLTNAAGALAATITASNGGQIFLREQTIPTNAASFVNVTTNLVEGQPYTNFLQRGMVKATIAMTNILAGDVSAMSLIVDQDADGTWDETNGPVRINGVALSAGSEQLIGWLQPGARFAFTNQSAGITPSAAIVPGTCRWGRF